MIPALLQPSTMAGMITYRQSSKPATGSHRSLTAKRYWNSSADQKTGMETPRREKPMNRLSGSEYFLTAERMPAGIPTIQANRAAQTARTKVFGKAPRMSDVTGLFSL